jgi:UDP-N-acetylmuramate dehydrogenase
MKNSGKKILLKGINKNVLLEKFTTFKIGGRAKYFFTAKNKESFIQALNWAAKNSLPSFVLGGGSNLLIADAGFNGLVIKNENKKCKTKGKKIFTGSGTPLVALLKYAVKNRLTGLEWSVGIPGTVGGAIFGNAGAFGESIRDCLAEAEVFDVKNKKIIIFKNIDCKFSYRQSIFKRNKNLVIISATFFLKKSTSKAINKKIKNFLNYRNAHQPLNFSSAGSVFANPKNFSAGELIEKCGLKGKKIGNAKFSEKHANFIVNLGKARACDIKKLINLAKKSVKNKFGVDLEEEIRYLP